MEKANVLLSYCYYEDSFDLRVPWKGLRDPQESAGGTLRTAAFEVPSGKVRLAPYLTWAHAGREAERRGGG